MLVCLEQGAECLRMVQLMSKPITPSSRFIKTQTGFTFMLPAYAGCPGKEAVLNRCSGSSSNQVSNSISFC